jgi:hypothetical protein
LQNLREIRVVDATNSEHRKAHLAYNSGQLLQPLRGAISDLGGGRKDRAKNDEISAIFGSTAGFLNTMGGDPQELPSAQHAASHRRRKRMARQVHASSIESQSHIETIINQQWHSIRGDGCLDTGPQGIEVTGAEVFLAQLDSPSATPGRGDDNLLKGTPSRLLAIRDNIEVEIDTG